MVCQNCGQELRGLYSLRSREVKIKDGVAKSIQEERREIHVCVNTRCRELWGIRWAA